MSRAGSSVSALSAQLTKSALSRPDHVAVRSGGRAVTQAELSAWAAELAGRVVAATPVTASGPWTPVLVDWSVRSVVAVHAMVWAGQRFALIDATAPASRIADMWGQMGDPRIAVVTDDSHRSALPAGVLAVPVEAAPDERAVALDPQPVVAEEAGVVIFTSGSTGRPKGVMKDWGSFDRALTSQLTMWPDGLERRPDHGHLRPLYFNGAINVAALTALGCTVELFDPGAGDMEGLLDRIHAAGLGSIGPGPALAAAMVRAADGARRLPLVRSVNLGGASCPWELVAGIRTLAAPDVRVRAGYGATEAGNVMNHRVDPGAPIGVGSLPMGRPADPTRLRLVAVEPGSALSEVWIRDPEALGYLGDPELTAARFVTVDGARWWLSGDVADVDAEGVFHHRGRVDDLVKINGMRVEPREPEGALKAVPGVRDAVVLAQVNDRGQPRLVAHLCLDDPTLTARHVRDELLRTLPGYLVPSVFVRHERFGLTASGKIDRQTLKAAPIVPWGVAPPRWPTDEVERAVTGICRELLDQPDLGPDDDLWLMGLDSLAAVELCTALADEGLGEFDPRALLDMSTPALLTRALKAGRPGGRQRDSDLAVLNADGTRPPVFGMPGAGQTALAMLSLARALGPDQPVVVAEPHGMHTRGRPDRSVEALAARARLEIDQFLGDRAGDDIVVFGHSAGATTAYELAQQRSRAGRRTRVVLVDGVPNAAGRPPDAPPIPERAITWVEQPRLQGRWRQLPAIARRQALILWFELFPGRPRAQPQRYLAFYRRFGRLVRRYRAQPARFPCTLVHVDGANSPMKARELIADLELRSIGGNHRTCMDHPHVVVVAAAIRDAQAAISRR